ncbi:MAG: hypothetical protein H0U70_01060 [Tatlockia sp.]|nr:hypothetical protein [Tatlockia sp.]
MAIKKGAFEQYIQERKLPDKKLTNPFKKTHFFDDVYKEDNGSQTVHKRFTSSEGILNTSEINLNVKDTKDNATQTLTEKNKTTNKIEIEIEIDNSNPITPESNNVNGSQLVHKRFTNGGEISSPPEINVNIKDTEDNDIQTSTEKSKTTNKIEIDNSNPITIESNNINGSQMVHKRFKSNQRLIEIDDTSTLEHNFYLTANERKLTTSFSRLIGNQREIVIALYKNMRLNKAEATEELTLETISNLTGVNQKSLKNTLFRLTSAGVISRSDQKIGRGGWVKYQINSDIINEIKQNDFYVTSKIKK